MNISGYKWNDISGDGKWSGGETALATWTIYLSDAPNLDPANIIATDVTDASGQYQFYNLAPSLDVNGDGKFYIFEKIEPGFTQTYPGGTQYFTFSIQSGATLTGDLNTTEAGNFGNNMPTGYVRTPGFWASKQWADFWDNDFGVPKQAGDTGFPSLARGDLIKYGHTDGTVDSNGDGKINGDDVGLLIGDYSGDGKTGAGEDTLFISLADAKLLIDASSKNANGADNSNDGAWVLGRDMVATWLNYLAGANVGPDAGTGDRSPSHFINDAIDWMQEFAGATNLTGATHTTAAASQAVFFDYRNDNPAKPLTPGTGDDTITPSNALYNAPVAGVADHAAALMHSELDYYNNTGATYVTLDPLVIFQHYSIHI